jgi:hypothetical protein
MAAPIPTAVPAPPEAVHAGPVARRQASSPRGGFAATPRAAGIAAVLLLALVGVTAVVTSQDRPARGTGGSPALATMAPTEAPPADAGGGNGNGKDKDKDGKGNGNGNGKGNGSD